MIIYFALWGSVGPAAASQVCSHIFPVRWRRLCSTITVIASRDVVENYAQLSPSFVCQGTMAGTCFIYLFIFFPAAFGNDAMSASGCRDFQGGCCQWDSGNAKNYTVSLHHQRCYGTDGFGLSFSFFPLPRWTMKHIFLNLSPLFPLSPLFFCPFFYLATVLPACIWASVTLPDSLEDHQAVFHQAAKCRRVGPTSVCCE